ncbi:hypothetical protein O6H91_20G056700 [Diphasiastrum complanatum]|uniref:Uncharacterized protein n=1 Tax=Diphasiastrum complanatum TaxID=34168 RepID=A0ACC2AQP7_DIPCM|nr:hypothetical protein O6H91_20G056700 [Diphasiastrum complanatum]
MAEEVRLPFCTIVSLHRSSLWYHVCKSCERVLPELRNSGGKHFTSMENGEECHHCLGNLLKNGIGSSRKRVYRLLLSVATEDKVMVVVAFDRAARVLMGCSADDFYKFVSHDPSVELAGKLLEGHMVDIVLKHPKSGHAQHMRATSILPLSCNFQPVFQTIEKAYAKISNNICLVGSSLMH